MADTLLDVINENDEVIGQALRSEIHTKGLLHRAIHVWFITPEKQIILQKRSMSKDTDPGLLTMAVGGHVESGASCDETALIEVVEETGFAVHTEHLNYLTVKKRDYNDKITGSIDCERQNLYGLVFKGHVEDLKVEEGESDGYIIVKWNDMSNPAEDFISICAPGLIDEFSLIKDKLEALVL